jgi:hypothetical protein
MRGVHPEDAALGQVMAIKTCEQAAIFRSLRWRDHEFTKKSQQGSASLFRPLSPKATKAWWLANIRRSGTITENPATNQERSDQPASDEAIVAGSLLQLGGGRPAIRSSWLVQHLKLQPTRPLAGY